MRQPTPELTCLSLKKHDVLLGLAGTDQLSINLESRRTYGVRRRCSASLSLRMPGLGSHHSLPEMIFGRDEVG
jgi:hypothetical protein